MVWAALLAVVTLGGPLYVLAAQHRRLRKQRRKQ